MTGLTGTWRLTRLALRRDRVIQSAWILAIGAFVAATTALFAHDLAARADLVRETRLVATNTGMRLLGITSGPSVGGYMLHREYVTLAALSALMSTMAVVRHTRQNEELGREEMLGATVVGRYAGLAAAVIVAVVADVVLGIVLAVAVLVGGLPASGAILTGASVAAVGIVFVGVAAVAGQLASTSRGAIGLSAGVLGVAFGLSGVGNMLGHVDAAGLRVESAWPAWLSPIGWGQQMRPFNDALWWPLALFAVLLLVLLAGAVLLAGRRDMGRGVLPERRGHARAGGTLPTTIGLAWHLQRGALVGWAVALLVFGLIFGTLTEQIRGMHGGAADWYTKAAGTQVVLDAYQASIIQIAGMFVAIYVVQVLLRLRTDEAGGTAEPVLATGVSRVRWVLSHAANAAVGAVLLVLVFTVSMGLTTGQVLGDTVTQVRELTLAGLVQLPGVFVLGAAVVAAVGLLPRWAAPVSWSLLVACLVIGPMFGPALTLPQWVRDASPFTHVPMVPAVDLNGVPLMLLLAACLALGIGGLYAVRRRDLALPA